MKMPSKRTWLKFLRDGGVALVVAGGVYVSESFGLLGFDPIVSAMVVPAALWIVRWGRGYLGKEPE